MPELSGAILDYVGIVAVILLVAANGFFVAAEFALVSVRRSRVTELVAARRSNAAALQVAVDNLDANLAATQLGITISSLALGWVGEPALAHLIEPALFWLPSGWILAGSHTIAVAISFVIITSLHIVLGELAPKSLALQRSEGTSLAVVRPLGAFLFLFRPAIYFLNGMGNLVLRMFGLKPGAGEGSFHSPQELKLLVAESQEAGLLNETQQQLVERVFNIGERHIAGVMTPRLEVYWIDADDPPSAILTTIRECPHEQLLIGRGSIVDPIGLVLKKDLLDQLLDGRELDPMSVVHAPLVVHERTSVFRVLESFKTSPVRLAIVIDEYGSLEGIVTQTDLLEAIAGDLAGSDAEEPDIILRPDGTLLVSGTMPAFDAFQKFGFSESLSRNGFHTVAGFALHQLQHIPEVGEVFEAGGWRFEIVDMDGMRIDKILATRVSEPGSHRNLV
ncbi:hemolysin family protein [Rhizobium grahamii]|uniref:Hemolysin n=1 Tax=Rhizobium grahamii TaxID=1120045 RepID=A0A370KFH4_9HYPH|nr:hemolysin family protein [Rhizobium grahamii]RDJ03156.1 hemolysin [Rhizobium grahamii]